MHMGMTKERLLDLQRTVDTLQGRVQDMQWELRHAKRDSLAERWWRHLLGGQGNAFMSACLAAFFFFLAAAFSSAVMLAAAA